MKMKKLLLVLILMIVIFSVKDVFASDTDLYFETTINHWKPNNELYLKHPARVDPSSTLQLNCDENLIDLDSDGGYVFADISDECESAVLIETVDMSVLEQFFPPGTGSLYIAPYLIDTNMGEDLLSDSTSIQNYMFSGYDPNPVDSSILNDEYMLEVNYYISNYGTLDEVFFNDGQHNTTIDLGEVNFVDDYCLKFDLTLRGRLARTDGRFFVYDHDVTMGLSGTYNQSPMLHCGLTGTEFKTFYDSNYITGGYGFGSTVTSIDPSYDTTVSLYGEELGFDQAVEEDNGVFYLHYSVIADNSADIPNTGLFYDILPFILIMIFGGMAIFVFQRNNQNNLLEITDEGDNN